jgi:hypothetical protein
MKRNLLLKLPIIATLSISLIGQSCASRTGVYSSVAADAGTTAIILQSGGVEKVMGTQSALGIAVIQTTVAYLLVKCSDRMKANGSPYWKVPLRIFSTIHFAAAGWNATQIAKENRR